MLQSYLFLSMVSLLITIISFFVEMKYPFINDLLTVDIVSIFILRYMHLLVGIFFMTFLFLFEANSLDGFLYLIFAICLAFSSELFGYCILSYYELKMYENLNYCTTFHPCTFVFFRKYHELPLALMGVLLCVTFYYILFKIKMAFSYKFMLGFIFIYLFCNNIINLQYKKKYNDSISDVSILHKNY